MQIRLLATGLVLATLLASSDSARAQSRGGTGGGTTGMGAGGTSMGASAGGRGAQTGGRNLGSTLSPGNRTFSGSGRGSSNLDATIGGAGELSGGERFLRGNRQPGQFVGGDSGDLGSFIGASTGGGGGQAGMNLGQMGQARRGGQNVNAGSSQRTTRTTVPVRVQVAFEYRAAEPPRVTASLGQRFDRIRPLSSVQVQVQGRVAVLRGAVATEHDRAVAEQLARLEPGISAVRNELTVAQVLPAPTSGAAARQVVP